jgi:glutathione S-transferase
MAQTTQVEVYGFETSNSLKVRVALGYKEIPYQFHTIDPADRSAIVRLSGQYLTPVMVHADRVLFDSAAILRYLEANFRDRPRLFGASRDEQWAIEDHELFARTVLAGPMMELVHHRVSKGSASEAMERRCADAFAEAARRLIESLDGRQWLVGDRMSAADVTGGAVMHRVRVSKLFPTPDGAERIEGWIDRVMAYDRPGRQGAPAPR